MKNGIGLVQPDRPFDVLDGDLMRTPLGSHHAEKMERIGLIRLDLQNLPIYLLGSLQAASLMVLDSDRQGFGNRRHDVDYGNATCHPQGVSRERATTSGR
jgi:hypothetical protein